MTPALLQKTAQEYLRPGNRTVYVITPGQDRCGGSGRGNEETRRCDDLP